MYLNATGWEAVGCVHLHEDRDLIQDIISAEINPRVQ
jgi:hypothetical protein